MTTHSNSRLTTCPDCGLTLPKNAPAGLCPACLLRLVMGAESGTDFNGNAGSPDHSAGIEATSGTVEQGAAHRGNSITALHLGELKTDDYPSPGTTLRYFGDYELHEEIARGGMGVVYRARQVRLNRRVALKMIRAGKFSSGTEIQRLRVEAEAAAQLDHPAIVPVFEVGEHEGLHYFTMAFVDGDTLSARLAAGPIPVSAAARLMQTVCEAVAYAHDKGVIHRDLKPGNILIDQSGQPRVSDFGLAKQVSSDNELTTTGQILGTPSYMPPEQALGKLEEVGRSSDVYSLGAVLYAALTGRPPFQAGTSVETLRLVVEELPLAPRLLNPSIPRDLETICLKCLEKLISQRYESAKEVAEELGRFLDGEPILAQPAGRLRKLSRWYRRHWATATTGLVVLLSVSVVAGVLASTTRRLTSELEKTANAEESERLAHAKSQELLWLSYLSEANANHRSRQSGQRFRTLEAIRSALQLPVPAGHSLDELRTEAIAALCLPDLEVVQRVPHNSRIGQIALSIDQSLYGFDDRDSGKFIVREVVSGRERFRLNFVSSSFDYHSQTFSPDSRFLVYPRQLDGKTSLCVWRTSDGQFVADLGESANCFEFRKDSEQLAVVDMDGTVRIRNVRDFSEIRSIPTGLTGAEVSWNPAAQQILVMGQQSWKVIDLPSEKVISECVVNEGLEGWPNWFGTGTQFVIGMRNARIGIWDSESARLAANPLRGHRAHGVITRLCPDEKQLVSNDWSSILRLWDLRTGQQMLSVPVRGTKLQFTPDGKHLGADCGPSEMRILRYDPGREFRSISTHPGAVSQFLAVHSVPCINSSGRILAIRTAQGLSLIDLWHDVVAGSISVLGDGPFRFNQTGDGEQLWTYGQHGLLSWPIHVDEVSSVATIGRAEKVADLATHNVWGSSRDGQILLVPWGDASVVWNRFRNEDFILANQKDVRTCAVSPDGRFGITGSHSDADCGAVVWNLETRTIEAALAIPPGGVFLSPDGKWLVTNGGQTRLWEFGNWAHSRIIYPESTQVCFSPDSKIMAVTDGLSRVRLMDPVSGGEIAVLTAPQATRLLPLTFTPDAGRLITLGSETGAVHIFDLKRIRRSLCDLNLDWSQPDLTLAEPEKPNSAPLQFKPLESGDSNLLTFRQGLLPTNSEKVLVTRASIVSVAERSDHLNVLTQKLQSFGSGFPIEDHVLVNGRKSGDFIELDVPVLQPGKVRVWVQMTESYDFGIVGFHVNGQKSEVEFDGYSPDVRPSPQIQLGEFQVEDETFRLRVEVLDSNPLSASPHFYFAVAAIAVEQLHQ